MTQTEMENMCKWDRIFCGVLVACEP